MLTFAFQVSAQTTLGPLSPETDVHMDIQNGTRYNNQNVLQITSGRITYIKYDLTGVSGTINTVTLNARPSSYNGAAVFKISSGSHSTWSISDTSDLPTPVTELANFSSIGGSWSPITINLSTNDSSVYTGGMLTLIVEHTSGTTFGFARVGNNNPGSLDSKVPKLTVQYTPGSSNDTQAPNVPTGLTVNSFDHESASISWNASSDNGGGSVAGYYIYDNGSQIASSTSTSANLTGLVAENLYQLSVAAYDDATTPNVSSQSSPTVNFTTSTTPGGGGGNVSEVDGTGVTNIFYDGQNIGMGTNPQSAYRLAVEGGIRSREVKVDNDNWADYVFFKDYNLPTLKEVEKHIEEKGHLINIPSATEVEANGIELGEMNKLLLEKIEELTLYILQQEKRIQELENNN